MKTEGANSSRLKIVGVTIAKHIAAIAVMLFCCFMVVPEAFDGKVILQGDKLQSLGTKRDVKAHHQRTGELTNWTDRMYSGMPTTLIYPVYPNNLASTFINSLENWTQPQVVHLMLPMLCIYIALLIAGYPIGLSLLGALAFGLSTINIGNMVAAHSTKVKAIATAIPVLFGLQLLFERRYVRGFLLMVTFGAMHLATNHLQITYYALLAGLIIALVGVGVLIKSGKGRSVLKATAFAVIAVLIGILPNASMLWSNYAYVKDSVRGERILKSAETNSGLDRDYAYVFSHDFLELGSLILPRIVGGSTNEMLGKDSESYKYIKRTGLQGSRISNNSVVVPLFWGEKPINESPTYVGIGVFCIFLLGLLFCGKVLRIAFGLVLLGYTVIALGDNLGFINELMFNYIPFFNKFRAPSMVLGLSVGLIIWIAVDGLHRLLKNPELIHCKKKQLIRMAATVAFFFLFFAILGPSVFDFSWDYSTQTHGLGIDENFKRQLVNAGDPAQMVDKLLEAFRSDRASAMRSDALRGLAFLALIGLCVISILKNWLKPYQATIAMGFVCVIDLVTIDTNYTQTAVFEKTRNIRRFFPQDEADITIGRRKLAYDRVVDLTRPVMQDARPSYYFNNIGGNHAAKLRRYQDLIERHISKELQLVKSASKQADVPVLNMLNTRFLKFGYGPNDYRENITSNGFAWFVDSIAWVKSPGEEIEALGKLKRSEFAIVDHQFKNELKEVVDSPSEFNKIELTAKSPGTVQYLATTDKTKLLVMSEIWYEGNNYWKSFVDGVQVDHVRVNYLLRGIVVPSGSHKVRFEYTALPFEKGEPIAAAGSGIWILSIFTSLILLGKKDV